MGVIALVLGVAAVAARRDHPEVIALAAVGVASGAIAFLPVLGLIFGTLPIVGSIAWHRALLPLVFAIAILTGIGINALVRLDRVIRRWSSIGFALAGLLLIVLFFSTVRGLPSVEETIRAESFIWPTIETVVGLLVFGMLTIWTRRHLPSEPSTTWPSTESSAQEAERISMTSDRVFRRAFKSRPHWFGPGRWAALVLLACETAFLIAAGAPLWSSSPNFFTATPAESSLQRLVGSKTVAIGAGDCLKLGIRPNVNAMYGIHELNAYDPAIPKTYFTTWRALTGQSPGLASYNEFCPLVNTVALARLFGVEFILEPHGRSGPQGSVSVARLGDEDLYHVPGAAVATLTPELNGIPPGTDALGAPIAVTNPSPSSMELETHSAKPAVLRLRLTNIPGWHASIDGKPLSLETFSGVMLQAQIPGGRHKIQLHYWPDTFNVGLILAGCSAAALAAALLVEQKRRRHPVTYPSSQTGPTGR